MVLVLGLIRHVRVADPGDMRSELIKVLKVMRSLSIMLCSTPSGRKIINRKTQCVVDN